MGRLNLLGFRTTGRSPACEIRHEEVRRARFPPVASQSGELPVARSVCYKPYMRKWMSDRLKRRKKPKESKPSEPAQAPLQPAYFDAEAAPAEPVKATEPELSDDSGLIEVPEPERAVVAEDTASVEARPEGQQRPRRRRTRGGRGRKSGSRPTPQASPATPTVPEPATAATTVPIPAAPPRPPKGTVVLAIGLPGSGKSSWFKRNNINASARW